MASSLVDLPETQLTLIYAALKGTKLDPANGQLQTANALREAGLTPNDAAGVLLNMVERGSKITPATLKVELAKRAEQAAFEADSEDSDAPSEGDDSAVNRPPRATCVRVA